MTPAREHHFMPLSSIPESEQCQFCRLQRKQAPNGKPGCYLYRGGPWIFQAKRNMAQHARERFDEAWLDMEQIFYPPRVAFIPPCEEPI